MELTWAHNLVMQFAKEFEPSQVIEANTGSREDSSFRRSYVLFNVGRFQDLMANRLARFLPQIVYRLTVPLFNIREVELQLTSSGNRGFFRAHTDSDGPTVSGRAVTFVLFCHREPRAFSGGELRIYGRDPETGSHLTDVATVIRPSQNRMVLFPSDRLHEITPVSCRSSNLLDTRLTLNGWLHR